MYIYNLFTQHRGNYYVLSQLQLMKVQCIQYSEYTNILWHYNMAASSGPKKALIKIARLCYISLNWFVIAADIISQSFTILINLPKMAGNE